MAPSQKIRILSTSPRGNFVFRHGPENITWSYNLRTNSTETYGGRVVQILGCDLGDLSFTTMSGKGGEQYRRAVVLYWRDIMLWQRETQKTVRISLPSRGYDFRGYLKSISFSDSLTDVSRQISCTFAIQQDVSGILTSKTISDELKRIQEGIGYTRNEFNTPITDEKKNAITDSPGGNANPLRGKQPTVDVNVDKNGKVTVTKPPPISM